MKKIINLFLLSVCLTALIANDTSYSKWGADIGFRYGWLDYVYNLPNEANIGKPSGQFGYHIAVTSTIYGLIPYIIIEDGLRLKINQGYIKKVPSDSWYVHTDYTLSTHLHYLDYYTKLKFGGDVIPLNPFVGLYIGYLLAADHRVERNGNTLKYSILDDCNRWDFGWMFGMDYDIKNKVQVGFAVEPGFTNVAKKKTGFDSKKTNMSYLVRIGYMF